MIQPDRRLTRSSSDRMVGGVAAGLASYFGFDIAIVRVVWALLLIAGVGIPLYAIFWIVVPRELASTDGTFDRLPVRRNPFRTLVKFAVLFIAAAAVADQISTDAGVIAFAVGLLVGIVYLYRNRDGSDEPRRLIDMSRFHRSESDRKILGVFGGLSENFGIDATLLRIAGVLTLVAGFPVVIPLYFVYAFVVPSRRLISI